jgi:SPW repeat
MLTLTRDYAAQARTASGINILMGLWLLASPWVFDYSARPAVVSSVCAGATQRTFPPRRTT